MAKLINIKTIIIKRNIKFQVKLFSKQVILYKSENKVNRRKQNKTLV